MSNSVSVRMPDGGLTIDTQSAIDRLLEIATYVDGSHPFQRYDWPNTAATLRDLAGLVKALESEILESRGRLAAISSVAAGMDEGGWRDARVHIMRHATQTD